MGRSIKKSNIIILAWIIGLLLTGLFPRSVLADDPPAPTNLQLESVKVCRHVIEEDDFILAFHYNIHYDADQPDEPANKLFTFRLLDTNGIDYLGAVVPYAYNNSGYDQGVAAFYFPAATAPDWEQAYVLRVAGNPEYFSSPPLTSYTLTLSDYSQMDTQKENQTVLGNFILDVARDLEINWSTTLLYAGDLGTVLYSTGETYFRGAIPGLQVMAPQIFPVQTTSPEYEETAYTETQGKSWEERFAGTWVVQALEGMGNLLHMKWNVITGILVLGAIIAFAVWSQKQYETIKPALVSGSVIMIGGTELGWVASAIMAIVTIFFALFLGYVWIFRHG
jgi:hypothetical protein